MSKQYTISGLEEGTAYTVRVRALSASGDVIAEGETVFKTDVKIDITLTAITESSASFSWEAVEDAVVQQVLWTVHGVDWVDIPVEQTTYNVTGLEPGTEYSFIVSVSDEEDHQTGFGLIEFTTTVLSLDAPVNALLELFESASGNVRYSWHTVEGAESYEIAFSQNAFSVWVPVSGTSINGQLPEGEHQFKVRAVNGEVKSEATTSNILAVPSTTSGFCISNIELTPGTGITEEGTPVRVDFDYSSTDCPDGCIMSFGRKDGGEIEPLQAIFPGYHVYLSDGEWEIGIAICETCVSPPVGCGEITWGEETVTVSGQIVLGAVTTFEVTGVQQHQATFNYEITSLGNASSVVGGIVYSASPNPNLYDLVVSEQQTDIGIFAAPTVGGLTSETTFYYRAFITNEAGTVYGEELSFMTLAEVPPSIELPTVRTGSLTARSPEEFLCDGYVDSSGGGSLTHTGFRVRVGAITQNIDGVKTGAGQYTGTVQAEPGLTYYVAFYATNEAGTAVGEDKSITMPVAVEPPAPPTNLFVIPESLTSTTVSIAYTPSVTEGVDQHYIYLFTPEQNIDDYESSTKWAYGAPPVTFGGSEFPSMYLEPDTTYKVRGRAEKDGVSSELSMTLIFATLSGASAPTARSVGVRNITHITADFEGSVDGDGGESIIETGVIYKEDITGSEEQRIATSSPVSLGSFTKTLSSLKPTQRYLARAYARNTKGEGRGEILELQTIESPPAIQTSTYESSFFYSENNPLGVVHISSGVTLSLNGDDKPHLLGIAYSYIDGVPEGSAVAWRSPETGYVFEAGFYVIDFSTVPAMPFGTLYLRAVAGMKESEDDIEIVSRADNQKALPFNFDWV